MRYTAEGLPDNREGLRGAEVTKKLATTSGGKRGDGMGLEAKTSLRLAIHSFAWNNLPAEAKKTGSEAALPDLSYDCISSGLSSQFLTFLPFHVRSFGLSQLLLFASKYETRR